MYRDLECVYPCRSCGGLGGGHCVSASMAVLPQLLHLREDAEGGAANEVGDVELCSALDPVCPMITFVCDEFT